MSRSFSPFLIVTDRLAGAVHRWPRASWRVSFGHGGFLRPESIARSLPSCPAAPSTTFEADQTNAEISSPYHANPVRRLKSSQWSSRRSVQNMPNIHALVRQCLCWLRRCFRFAADAPGRSGDEWVNVTNNSAAEKWAPTAVQLHDRRFPAAMRHRRPVPASWRAVEDVQ